MTLNYRMVSVFVFMAWAAAGRAGLIVESTVREGNGAEVASKMIMDSVGLRTDSPEGAFIFRPDKQLVWMLDPSKKEYHQITESELTQMSSKMDEAMKQMKEQLDQLPPEQRVMVEQMMKSQMPAGIPAGDLGGASVPVVKTTYEKVGEDEKVGSWNCDKYVEMENGVKVGEVWTVPALTFLSFTKYFKMLMKLGDFFGKMPMDQAKAFEIPLLKVSEGEEEGGLSGIPVKEIRYKADGSVVSSWELKKVTEEAVDALVFEIPKDYKQRALMEEP